MTFDEVRNFALSLPEAAEEPHFDLISFRIRGKIFATAPPASAELRIFVGEEDRARALNEDPQAISKLHWGAKVLGVKVDIDRASPDLVCELLYLAWSRKAPKSIAASFDYPAKIETD